MPGACEPRLSRLKAKGFDFGLSRRIKQREQPEHSCHWQLLIGPLRRYHLEQKHTLYALVDPISPPSQAAAIICGLWWRRRVPPPGPMGLLRWPFIAIAGLAVGKVNIGGRRKEEKGMDYALQWPFFANNHKSDPNAQAVPRRYGILTVGQLWTAASQHLPCH